MRARGVERCGAHCWRPAAWRAGWMNQVRDGHGGRAAAVGGARRLDAKGRRLIMSVARSAMAVAQEEVVVVGVR